MIDQQLKFLNAVLGEDGAQALGKATESSTMLNKFLVPRTIISWVSNIDSYDGSLPGVDSLNVTFNKSEKGYTGKVGQYEFIDESLTHLVAYLSVVMGVDGSTENPSKSMELEKLGKSLDLLVKKNKKKKVEKALEANEELDKAIEAPVKEAAPVAPQAPIATDKSPAVKPANPSPVAKTPKQPKAGATVSLTRSEMNHACPMCAGKQFDGNEFIGCVCFSELKKSVEVLHVDELGIVVHINESMGDIVTLLEAMGRG